MVMETYIMMNTFWNAEQGYVVARGIKDGEILRYQSNMSVNITSYLLDKSDRW